MDVCKKFANCKRCGNNFCLKTEHGNTVKLLMIPVCKNCYDYKQSINNCVIITEENV